MGEEEKNTEKPGMGIASAILSNKPVTRAKSVTECVTYGERVDFIVEEMHEDRWVRGKSAPLLAAEWGLAIGTVEKMSSEASRRVLAEVKDPDRLMAKGLSRIEQIADESLADARGEGDDKPSRLEAATARKVAIDAYHKLLTLAGAAAPQKVVLELEKLSDEEVERRYNEARGRLLSKGEEGETDE